ncbi:MAG: Rne/Rng family ribonuclease [candidate division Zixibacteria bacterium]|nr:Rne/Rng family ribonuclease [candidate division Zixibacteria bacterium]
MKKEIVVNVGEHETRIALLENDLMVELHIERSDESRMVGDIYKGKVSTVLPGMQAAFIEIGTEKAAFLHSSDIGIAASSNRRYQLDDDEDGFEVVRKHRHESIDKILSQRQEIIVQVIKEPMMTKGPRVTSDISLPGRFSVLAPNSDYIRVSRRITDPAERKRLRTLVYDVKPEGVGIIVRTEGAGRTEKEFKSDIRRLSKIWGEIKRKLEKSRAPALLHKEEEMTSSVIRDVFTTDVDRLIVDDRSAFRQIVKYVKSIDPTLRDKVEFYQSEVPVFDTFDIEKEIDKMLDRKIWLKRGAHIIIDQTEALVTIDVNTGRSVGRSDPEHLILQTNLEAAHEAARQIRLRDIGGLLIIDFIDMYSHDNRRKLFEEFKKYFANDRARNSITPVSDFGLIEMTRERIRPSILYTFSETCPMCKGFGRILSKETLSMKIDRWFMRAKAAKAGKNFILCCHAELARFLRNDEADRIREIEKAHRFKIELSIDESLAPDEYRIISKEENVDVTALYQKTR